MDTHSSAHSPLRIGILLSGRGSNFLAIAESIKTGKLTSVCLLYTSAAAMFLKAFVGDMVEQEKAIGKLADHCGFSREKISSVGQEKMRANVRASSRLGT